MDVDNDDAYYHQIGHALCGPFLWILFGELQDGVPPLGIIRSEADRPQAFRILAPWLYWHGAGAATLIVGKAGKPAAPAMA